MKTRLQIDILILGTIRLTTQHLSLRSQINNRNTAVVDKDKDNIRLIPRLDNKEVGGMHLVLLVALVVRSIMDQEGMVVVVGGGIRLECEVEEMYAQRMEKGSWAYTALDM